MEDELIDSSQLSPPHRSALPGAGFLYPKSSDEERAEEHAKTKLEDASVAVVTNTNASGLDCVALLREAYDAALGVTNFEERIEEKLTDDEGDENEGKDDEGEPPLDEEVEEERPKSSVALMGPSPYSLEDDLQCVVGYAPEGVGVYACDPYPDKFRYVEGELAALVKIAGEIHQYDHHQWKSEVAEAVRDADVDLVVGKSDEEYSTNVTFCEFDCRFNERLSELATVTCDHDLWLNEDERSQDLVDYVYWTSKKEYVAVVDVYGADLPPVVEEHIAHRRVEKENLIQAAVDRTELETVGDWTVGVTYGQCLRNKTVDVLREAGVGAAIIVKPIGNASIRGSDDFERCHEVADLVDGGGHPEAAGCKPDIYDDMLDYAHHWTMQGAMTKRVIFRVFEQAADATAKTEAGAAADTEADDDAEGDEGVETEC